MKNLAIAVVVALALPLAAAAEEIPMPRMLKGMEKGQWRMQILEHPGAKPGQEMPAMTMCTDNLMKQAKAHRDESSDPQRCTERLLKDATTEAILEVSCPERTVTTTMRRESARSVLAEITSTGERPTHIRMRYTNLGPCREGQPVMTLDSNSEQCKRIEASLASMDPAKSCAGAGANRTECENGLRQQIAQAKAMCE